MSFAGISYAPVRARHSLFARACFRAHRACAGLCMRTCVHYCFRARGCVRVSASVGMGWRELCLWNLEPFIFRHHMAINCAARYRTSFCACSRLKRRFALSSWGDQRRRCLSETTWIRALNFHRLCTQNRASRHAIFTKVSASCICRTVFEKE